MRAFTENAGQASPWLSLEVIADSELSGAKSSQQVLAPPACWAPLPPSLSRVAPAPPHSALGVWGPSPVGNPFPIAFLPCFLNGSQSHYPGHGSPRPHHNPHLCPWQGPCPASSFSLALPQGPEPRPLPGRTPRIGRERFWTQSPSRGDSALPWCGAQDRRATPFPPASFGGSP